MASSGKWGRRAFGMASSSEVYSIHHAKGNQGQKTKPCGVHKVTYGVSGQGFEGTRMAQGAGQRASAYRGDGWHNQWGNRVRRNYENVGHMGKGMGWIMLLCKTPWGSPFCPPRWGKLDGIFPRQCPGDSPEGEGFRGFHSSVLSQCNLLSCSSQEQHTREVKHQEPPPSFRSATSPWDAQMNFTGQEAAHSPPDSTSCTADGRAGVWLILPFQKGWFGALWCLKKLVCFAQSRSPIKLGS